MPLQIDRPTRVFAVSSPSKKPPQHLISSKEPGERRARADVGTLGAAAVVSPRLLPHRRHPRSPGERRQLPLPELWAGDDRLAGTHGVTRGSRHRQRRGVPGTRRLRRFIPAASRARARAFRKSTDASTIGTSGQRGTRLQLTPRGDALPGAPDIVAVYAGRTDRLVTVRVDFAETIALQDDNGLTLAVDADGRAETGTLTNGLGIGWEWSFGDKRGMQNGSPMQHQRVGLVAAPTVWSRSFEIAWDDRALGERFCLLFPRRSPARWGRVRASLFPG